MQVRAEINGQDLVAAKVPGNNRLPAQKKKVLFVIDTLEMGGAEQSLLENCSRFTLIEPVVCHLYAGDLLKQQFVQRGISVHSVNITAKYAFLKAFKQLSSILKVESPDLVVACLTRSEIVSRVVARINQIPVVGCFVSDLYAKSYNQSLSIKAKLAVSLFRWLNKVTAGFCTGFLANSEAIKIANARYLGIPQGKIEVVNRGRDSKLFSYNPSRVGSGQAPRFLTVGRLVPVKGQQDLLVAFRDVLKHCPGAVLHIVGEGPMRSSLVDTINKYKLDRNVILLGQRTDVQALLHQYDCFVFPSHSEGFSGAVVEAMMSGIPVLASDIPANKEMIIHRQTGYLFEAGSVDGITKAMLWYNSNREMAGDMARNAHNYAVQYFELGIVAGKLENYLSRLMH